MKSLDSIAELLHLLADPTRVRLMALLGRDELTVAELTTITALPQSRVSTHLGKLREAGLLRDRKVGASCFYAVNEASMPELASRVWELVAHEASDEVLEADQRRCVELKAERANDAWFDSIAGEMERHYSPGRTWEATLQGLLGLVRLGDVLDIGSGDGAIAELIAPRAASVTCLDRNERMLEAAAVRLKEAPNVHFSRGDMHELPFKEAAFDAVLLFNVLTYAHHPERVVAEAFRVLRPGGTASIVTLHTHSHPDVTSAYGHVRHGFSTGELSQLLSSAHFETQGCGIALRERRKPYFEVLAATAHKPNAR
ncbi:MAG: metalloregulator ArsR/SmtB family transcription factor [Polyangiaceae bacterium]|nr:metalloregulator ArsR/SmtB family transcription factor [Polyangiaceae bacterium]